MSIRDSFTKEELFLILNNYFEDINTKIKRVFFLILDIYFIFIYFLYFLIRSKAKRFLTLI